MTVKQLYQYCAQQIEKGNGNKTIFVSDDDEGNGYHELYYQFSENVKELDTWGAIDNPNKSIILG